MKHTRYGIIFSLLCLIFFHTQPIFRTDMAVPSDEDRPQFPGSKSTFTEKLEFLQPDSYDGIPVYRYSKATASSFLYKK